MKSNRIAFLVLFFFIKLTMSFAQIDTAFWFAAPWVTPDHAARHPIIAHISTFSASATVRLRQPAAPATYAYDTTINILPNSTFNYTFWKGAVATGPTPANRGYDSLEVRPADQVLPYGLYFSSTSNISIVYDVVTTGNNPETFSLKGQNGLGLEFVCPFQTRWFNQFKANFANTPAGVNQPISQINIVASQPNTVVWITPKCPIIGHPANITYSIMMTNAGDAYTIENPVQNTNVAGNNLSGTIVVSDKPISVTVADDSVRTPAGGCHDLMGDQIVPVDIVGTNYIINKGAMFAGAQEGAYIVATQNFTTVKITDVAVTTTTLNKGDTYFYNIQQPLTYVEADKNVYLWQADGIGCEVGAAILPPLNCAGSNLVAFSRNKILQFNLNILCKAGAETTFTLNGSTTLVPASAFTVVPGTLGLYVGAQIPFSAAQLPIGSYTIGNNADVFALGVFDGSGGGGALFHYMSSFLRKTFVTTQSVTPICVSPGVVAPLSGTVSGGAITGFWSTNGSGTFGAYTSTLGTISTNYTLSNADTLLSSLVFSLTSTGNCTPKTATMSVPIIQRPQVSIGTGSIICKNNVVPIVLTGTISNALGGTWSGGTGFFAPGVNISYAPTPADLAAGSITLTLSSVGGCTTTTRSLVVSFVDPPTITGLNGNVCTNTQSFVLSSSVVGSTVLPSWTTNNGTGFFTPTNIGLTPTYSLSVADYSLSVINFTVDLGPTGPCAAVQDVVQLTMRPKPLAIAPADFTVCANAGLINLNGSIGGSASTGTWNTVNGTGAFNPPPAPPVSSYTMSFGDMTIGTLTFVLTTDNGVYNCPNDTDTLKIAVLDAPVVTVNTNTSVCENAPVALTGTVTGYTNTGMWSSTGTGVFTPTNTALGGQYFPSNGDVANGTVTLTLLSTNNQGCPAQSGSFVATFVDAPKALFTVSSVRCKDSIITFINGSQANNTSNLAYNWNFGDGPPNGTSTSLNPLYTYTSIGSFVITLTVTGTNTLTIPNIQCPDTVSKRITVNPLPIANYNYLNACQGLPAQFRDSSIVIPGNILGWNWQFGDGSPSSPIKNPVHTFTTAGVYNVVLTAISNNSCAATISKLVTINPQPIANFGMTNDPTIALEPVYFSDFSAPTGSIVSWLWSFGDEGSGSGSSPTHVYQNSGMYVITLTVFDNNGCSDTASKTIDVQILPQVPTAFTPNKDNNNDLLFVKGGPFASMVFRVYNNWGELLFETNDQKIGWDGTKNGIDQPVGVYVWTLVVDMYNNRQVTKNGDVTIIR
ncbi:MAG: PKD domain-containing protein [Bacteroidota bacterium]|nr:PKD domain-containing protein [Bacteroidota bacterium]MDP3144624.1 PKD domain-containing protein [Bacteroidota bacterium]MDP3556563.1 PKD domain-containing protein [Bacteroidota bacterium]